MKTNIVFLSIAMLSVSFFAAPGMANDSSGDSAVAPASCPEGVPSITTGTYPKGTGLCTKCKVTSYPPYKYAYNCVPSVSKSHNGYAYKVYNLSKAFTCTTMNTNSLLICKPLNGYNILFSCLAGRGYGQWTRYEGGLIYKCSYPPQPLAPSSASKLAR